MQKPVTRRWTAAVVALFSACAAIAASAVIASFGASQQPAVSGPSSTSVFDPARTAFVVTDGAGGELPGCGAISAIDTLTGEVLYQSPRRGSRSDLAAAEDFSLFASGGGAGGDKRMYLLDAGAASPDEWAVRVFWSPAGPRQLNGSATAILNGDLYFGLHGGFEEGFGLGRVPLDRIEDTPDLQDVNPVEAVYSLRQLHLIQILPDPDGRHLHLLAQESRTPTSPTDVVETQALQIHTVDTTIMAARVAPQVLPPLVVSEPPGAGLREVGIHNWLQNGRLAYMTLLPAGAGGGPRDRWVAVNRLVAPEISFANIRGGSREAVTASLPADFTLAGAVAANHGWHNPGLLAVHGGDKVAVFDMDPLEGLLHERSRIDITPVVSSLLDDGRMMPGRIAWSADGSQLIVAGNEGTAEVLILDVGACGDTLTLRHVVTVCPYAEYNGLAGIVTANGSLPPPAPSPEACPTPFWMPEPWPVGSPFSLALPWVSAGG